MSRRFQGWTLEDTEPTRPLSSADLPELARMTLVALVAVIVGILLAPYLYGALLVLGEALA